MEVNKIEVAELSETSSSAEVSRVQELTDLQLAFVGGGIAELVGV